jgi:hypothetical protein
MDDANFSLQLAADPLTGWEGRVAVLYARPAGPLAPDRWAQLDYLRESAERAGLSVLASIGDEGSPQRGLDGLIAFVRAVHADGVVLMCGPAQLLPREHGYALGEIQASGWAVRVLERSP